MQKKRRRRRSVSGHMSRSSGHQSSEFITLVIETDDLVLQMVDDLPSFAIEFLTLFQLLLVFLHLHLLLVIDTHHLQHLSL